MDYRVLFMYNDQIHRADFETKELAVQGRAALREAGYKAGLMPKRPWFWLWRKFTKWDDSDKFPDWSQIWN